MPWPGRGETYLDWDTNEKKLVPMPIPKGIKEILAAGDIPLSNGWYIVKSTRNVGRVTVSGDVHLILADGCELTARTGIEVNSGSSLTIYAQSDSGSRGKLTATGAEYCAGIGGGDGGAGGTIAITSGQVTATGQDGGKDIGIGNDTTPGENDSVFIDDNATVKNESGKDLSHDPDIIIIHRPDNSKWEFDDTGHWHPCFGCNNPQHRTKPVAHSGGASDCINKAVCDECGQPYGEEHDWRAWKSNNDGTHTRACTRGCGVAEEKSCTPALRGQKDPTTDTEGYTGDLVCTLCGWLQKKGQAIPKLPAPREPGGSSGDCESIYHHENLSQGGVVLSGDRIHENARLTVTKDRLHDGGTCSDCDQIRQWQQQGRVIAIYDVSLDDGFRETVTITFPVPGQYNGKTLAIAHCLKGKLEIYETTIQNSKAKVTVDSLSPFVILTGDPAKENPETGGVLPADVPATTEIHTPAAPPETEETIPDAGEPENRASQAAEPAQAASIRQEGAKKAGGGAGIIAILAVLAAVACGGIWFWKRKRSI